MGRIIPFHRRSISTAATDGVLAPFGEMREIPAGLERNKRGKETRRSRNARKRVFNVFRAGRNRPRTAKENRASLLRSGQGTRKETFFLKEKKEGKRRKKKGRKKEGGGREIRAKEAHGNEQREEEKKPRNLVFAWSLLLLLT